MLLAAFTLASGAAIAAGEAQWHQIWLNGERVGSLKTERLIQGHQVTHIETFSVTLARADTDVAIRTIETHVETAEGEPVSFSLKQQLGDTEAVVEARREQNHWRTRQFDGKQWRDGSLDFPAGAVLSEGADLLEQAARSAGKGELRYIAFDPSSLSAIPVHVRFGGMESVATPVGKREGRRIDQTMTMNGASLTTVQWVDTDGALVHARTPMLGTTLEVVASNEADATRSARGGDLFELTTVKPPERLSKRQRRQDIDYWLQIEGDVELPKKSAEQQSRRVASEQCTPSTLVPEQCLRVTVDVAPTRRPDRSPPGDTERKANSWVQSDDVKIRDFARKAASGAKDDAERMKILTQAVSMRLSDKNLSSAYASAREAFDDRAGDCTEHALLLAAAARSLGIPTRIAAGLAYTEAFAGRSHVFVPHAWVQAWVGGQWQSFDAALGSYDSGHLLLATGNGDPGMYFGSLNALGNLQISRVRIHPESP